jgi:hypothetical protein
MTAKRVAHSAGACGTVPGQATQCRGRQHIAGAGGTVPGQVAGHEILVFAKIESAAAARNFDAILREADGITIARCAHARAPAHSPVIHQRSRSGAHIRARSLTRARTQGARKHAARTDAQPGAITRLPGATWAWSCRSRSSSRCRSSSSTSATRYGCMRHEVDISPNIEFAAC